MGDNVRGRGCVTFLIIIAFALFACGGAFFILPAIGIGMALPVIAVPGELVFEIGGIPITNTVIGTIVVDIILILLVLAVGNASRNWTNRVPGKFQGAVESLIMGFYNFSKGIGGDKLRTAPWLWPIVATIFLFLLVSNMSKLTPFYETIGKMHCAHVGYNGYPTQAGGVYQLYVTKALDAGTAQSQETEEVCHTFYTKYRAPLAVASAEEIETEIAAVQAEYDAAHAEVARLQDSGDEAALAAAEAHEVELHHELHFLELRHHAVEELEHLEAEFAAGHLTVPGAAADDHGEEATDDHGEEAAAEDHSETAATEEPAGDGEGEEPGAEGGAGDSVGEVTGPHAEDEGAADEHTEENVDSEEADTEVGIEQVDEGIFTTAKAAGDDIPDALNLARTQVRYPGAIFALSDDEIASGNIFPYIFHITPFLRGPATDLNLAFGLALMSVVLVQIYGVIALGPAYFEKFVNLSALGNLGKKPLGAIDFVVGLIEIISEIGKIVSLAFRLFGNIFAGGVALMAITFLVSLFIPGVIFALELVVGAVQALVFATLTLVFSVQAMTSHHGDHAEHEHHGEHGDEGYYDPEHLKGGHENPPVGTGH